MKSTPRHLGVSENKGVPYFGVLTIRILLFGVLFWGPYNKDPTIWGTIYLGVLYWSI